MFAELAAEVGPPRAEGPVVLAAACAPIQLRTQIVHAAVFQPGHRVAVDLLVHIAAGDARGQRDAFFLCDGVAGGPDAERRDTEGHPRCYGLDCVIYVLHHAVDVVATPVVHVHPRGFVQPLGRRVLIGRAAIGVEIVVEDDAVHVVFAQQVSHHFADAVTYGRDARVQDNLRVLSCVVDQPLGVRMFIVQGVVVSARPAGAGATAVAVGVHPCVTRQTAFVTFFQYKRQRVVTGIGASVHFQVTGPRLICAVVERIAARTNMETNRVQVQCCNRIEHLDHLFLLVRGGAVRWPVDVGHSRQPGRSHLALWTFRTRFRCR